MEKDKNYHSSLMAGIYLMEWYPYKKRHTRFDKRITDNSQPDKGKAMRHC